jgi:hypothetical protein
MVVPPKRDEREDDATQDALLHDCSSRVNEDGIPYRSAFVLADLPPSDGYQVTITQSTIHDGRPQILTKT